jgi:hypothetical protein
MTQQPDSPASRVSGDTGVTGDARESQDSRDAGNSLNTEVTPAEADNPYASAVPAEADADASGEPAPDVAEEYAESIPIDPTPEQVEHYLELAGDPDALTDSGTAESSTGG